MISPIALDLSLWADVKINHRASSHVRELKESEMTQLLEVGKFLI
jgi:hypothetical protein